jgi:hypothetical protein
VVPVPERQPGLPEVHELEELTTMGEDTVQKVADAVKADEATVKADVSKVCAFIAKYGTRLALGGAFIAGAVVGHIL